VHPPLISSEHRSVLRQKAAAATALHLRKLR
jgi:hypothetical protein